MKRKYFGIRFILSMSNNSLTSLTYLSFSYTTVITKLTQRLVILTIFVLNILLITLTITLVVKRDYSWQKIYLFLYLWGKLQFPPDYFLTGSSLVLFFEFFGFEPAGLIFFSPNISVSHSIFFVECIWIHYVLPTLIQADVEETVRVLYHAVDFAFANLALDNIILDVPNYFFLSTQVLSLPSFLFIAS